MHYKNVYPKVYPETLTEKKDFLEILTVSWRFYKIASKIVKITLNVKIVPFHGILFVKIFCLHVYFC